MRAGHRNRTRFACREIIKLFSNTQNRRFQQAQHWILKWAAKKEWHDNVKIMIRNPLGKFDSLVREAGAIHCRGMTPGPLPLLKSLNDRWPVHERLLGEAADCAHDSAHHARPGILLISNQCEGNFSLSRSGGHSYRAALKRQARTLQDNPNLQLRHQPGVMKSGQLFTTTASARCAIN